jgi:tRNA(Ile)-lysidine synthase
LSSLRGQSPLDRSGIDIVRPLLGFTRQEIAAYAGARRLSLCEDETNSSRAHTRNRLRHEVMPALAAAVGHDPVPALARAAEILAAEDDFFDEWACARALSAQIETRRLQREPVALQRRWLRAWLRAQTGSEIDFETVERARDLAASNEAPAKMNLPRGHHMRRRAGKLFVERTRRHK